MENPHAADTKDPESMDEKELKKLAKELEKKMRQAAAELNFEEAANLRDRMIEVRKCCSIYYEVLSSDYGDCVLARKEP